MSFGSRFWKRITPSSAERRSDRDREPEHEQRVREQRAEDRELRHDELAGAEREDHDEELRQVAERRLQHAGHRGAEPGAHRLGRDARSPTRRRRARPPRDEDRDRRARRCSGGRPPRSTSAKHRRPMMTRRSFSQPHEAHRLVHPRERRARGVPCLVGAERQQPQQLSLVGPELGIPLLHRREQLDDRLADVLLELAVAAVSVAAPRSPPAPGRMRPRGCRSGSRRPACRRCAAPRGPSRSPRSGTSCARRREGRAARSCPAACRRSSTSSASAPAGP